MEEESNLNNGNRFLGFMNIAYEDYISSRILFNNYKLLQGSILANTAIEKAFKSIMLASNLQIPKTHNLVKLYPYVLEVIPKFSEIINLEFITQLSKIYECRYLSDLPIGYNIVIVRRKYLAEIDRIFSSINSAFQVKIDNEIVELKYLSMLKDKSSELFIDNYILQNLEKKSFIEQLDSVFELRLLPDGRLIEILYPTLESRNNQVFKYDALEYEEDKHLNTSSAKLSHKIINSPIVDTHEGKQILNLKIE